MADWCKWCAYTDKDGSDDPCFECESDNDGTPTRFAPKRKPKTNADKYFRNATDEELAKIIVCAKYFDKFCEIVLAGGNPGFCDDDCNECALEWLKQEVQDADA